jgi:hypothetical protein
VRRRIACRTESGLSEAERTSTAEPAVARAACSAFSTIVGSAGYTFNPSTGSTVTITFPSASYRYVRLTFTANTGWPAGQVSEFQVRAT